MNAPHTDAAVEPQRATLAEAGCAWREAAQRAAQVAAQYADHVDRQARFPIEAFDERPWQLLPRFSANPLRFGWRVLLAVRRLPLATWNYRRNVHLHRDDEDYSVRTAAAHDFSSVIVYTTLPGQCRQLAALGFEVEAVYGSSEGDPIAPEQQNSDAWWLHFIARKLA